jgi:hypothetical protein
MNTNVLDQIEGRALRYKLLYDSSFRLKMDELLWWGKRGGLRNVERNPRYNLLVQEVFTIASQVLKG